MRRAVGVFLAFLFIFAGTLVLLTMPSQLAFMDEPFWGTFVTRRDVLDVFSVLSGSGSLVSFAYLVVTLRKEK